MPPPEPQYKLLLFFKRNPALSPSAFRADYEAHHVPMVMQLAAQDTTTGGLLRYTRRYLDHGASDPARGNPFTVFGAPAPVLDFDVVNEVTFRSRREAEEFARVLYGVEENAARLVADEERLFVRDQMRGMVVEEEIVSIE